MRELFFKLPKYLKLIIILTLVVAFISIGIYQTNRTVKNRSLLASEVKVNLKDPTIKITSSKPETPGMPVINVTPTPSWNNMFDGNLDTSYGDTNPLSVKIHFPSPIQVTRIKMKADCMAVFCSNLPKPYTYNWSSLATINMPSDPNYDPTSVIKNAVQVNDPTRGYQYAYSNTWMAKLNETTNKPDGTLKEYILPAATTATDVYVYLEDASPEAPLIYELEVYSTSIVPTQIVSVLTPTTSQTPTIAITPGATPTVAPSTSFSTKTYTMTATTIDPVTNITAFNLTNYVSGGVGQNFSKDFYVVESSTYPIKTFYAAIHPNYQVLEASLPANTNASKIKKFELNLNANCAVYNNTVYPTSMAKEDCYSGVDPQGKMETLLNNFTVIASCKDCQGVAEYGSTGVITRDGTGNYKINYSLQMTQRDALGNTVYGDVDKVKLYYNAHINDTFYHEVGSNETRTYRQDTFYMHTVSDFSIKSFATYAEAMGITEPGITPTTTTTTSGDEKDACPLRPAGDVAPLCTKELPAYTKAQSEFSYEISKNTIAYNQIIKDINAKYVTSRKSVEILSSNVADPLTKLKLDSWASTGKMPIFTNRDLTVITGVAADSLANMGSVMFNDWAQQQIVAPVEKRILTALNLVKHNNTKSTGTVALPKASYPPFKIALNIKLKDGKVVTGPELTGALFTQGNSSFNWTVSDLCNINSGFKNISIQGGLKLSATYKNGNALIRGAYTLDKDLSFSAVYTLPLK